MRVFLARGLSALPAADRVDEEADLRWSWVALDEAVAMALRGEIVNATAVAGILAAARVIERGDSVRPVYTPWTDRPVAFDRRKAARGEQG